jgi:hypothetical protein
MMSLFGRSEPLTIAGRALDDAMAGRGGALLVTGEAGIGKSALARTLTADAEKRGIRVALGRVWEVGGAPAFWPWSQALGELGLDLDDLLGSASAEMASAQRLVAFDRVVRAVCAADAAPVMVVLDDLHAADVASVELALAFARAARRRRALLVVTTRESELLERRAIGELVGKLAREGVTLPLRRLDAAATASWLASVSFHGDASEIHRLSEGNPLFIEEALRLGLDRFATAAAGGVAVILSEHLARISTTTRGILSVASILGRDASRVDVAALAAVTSDEVDAATREGQAAGVLTLAGNGAIAFSHVLLRDALYEALAPSRREGLHARAADRMEAQGAPSALVARHLLAAGEAVDASRVARTVGHAVEIAVLRHASDSAIEMLAHARAVLASRLDEGAMLMLDLAEVDANMRTTPSDEARARAASCSARAKQLGLAAEQARAALIYGREIIVGGVDPTMVALLEEALAAVPPEERSLRVQLLSRLAAALVPPWSDEGMARAEAYAREALTIAREMNHGPTLLHTLYWWVQALLFTVPLEERIEITSEIVSLSREHGADLMLVNLGGIHAMSLRESGRPVASRHEAEAYCRLVESLPLPALRWKATALRATMAALDGQIEEARRHGEELRRAGATSQHAMGAWTMFEMALSGCLRDVDRLRELERDISKVMREGIIVGPWMAPIEALLGETVRARTTLQSRMELTRDLPVILVQGQAVVLLGATDLAKVAYQRLLAVAPIGRFFWGAGATFPVGPVSLVLGELALLGGDLERAREHLDTAIAECRAAEAVPFLALAEQARTRAFGAPSTRAAVKPTGEVNPTLAREGDVWVVSATTSTPFRVKHAKGVEYLDHLLKNPGREVYVLSLAGAGEGPEDAGVILDERAKQAYKRRVEELEDQLAEAEQLADQGRASHAREELEELAEQLAAAVGLGGRDRKAASNVERARVNVQRRIKETIRRIAEHDAALGRYLDATVRTGTYCVYKPV